MKTLYPEYDQNWDGAYKGYKVYMNTVTGRVTNWALNLKLT